MARRKGGGGDDEGGYNWMDTYGDMVTLLLTFFVLLFAFSSVDDSKWEQLVVAVTGTAPKITITAIELLNMPNVSAAIPKLTFTAKAKEGEELTEVGELPTMNEEQEGEYMALSQEEKDAYEQEYVLVETAFSDLYERLVLYIDQNGLQNMLFAERDIDSIYLRVTTGILFDSGSAELLPGAPPVLDELHGLMVSATDAISMINIEGHTDNRPIRNSKYEDNWDLSTKRATNVARYMLEKQALQPELISCAGYGEYQPIGDNETEEGRQQNRRVTFVLKKKIVTMPGS